MAMAAPKEDPEPEQLLLVALSHPLRRRILKIMSDAGDPISPREVSDELDEPLYNVSYHVRVLAEHEAVSMIDQKPVRGAMQHFYAITIEEPWALSVLGLGDGKGNGAPEGAEHGEGGKAA